MGKPFSLTTLAAMSKKGVEIASHHFHTTPGTKFLALQCLFGVALLVLGSVLDARNVDIPGHGLRWLYLCGSVAASMFLWSCLVDLVYLWLELRYFLWLVMLPAFHTLFKVWLNMLAAFVLFSRLFDHSTVGGRAPQSLSPAEKWVKRLLLCGLLFMCVCVVVTGATGAVVAAFYSEGSRQKIVAALQHEYVMYRLIRDMLRCEGDPPSHHHHHHRPECKQHSPKPTYPPQQQQQTGLGRVSAHQNQQDQLQVLADQLLPQAPVESHHHHPQQQQPQQQQQQQEQQQQQQQPQQPQQQQQLPHQATSPASQVYGGACAPKRLSALATATIGSGINMSSNNHNISNSGSCDQLSLQPSHPPHLAAHLLHPLHHITPPPLSPFARAQRSRRRRSQRILLRTASTGGATAIATAATTPNGVVPSGPRNAAQGPVITMTTSPQSSNGVTLVVAAGVVAAGVVAAAAGSPVPVGSAASQQRERLQPEASGELLAAETGAGAGAGAGRRHRPQRVSWEVAAEARTEGGPRNPTAAAAAIEPNGVQSAVKAPEPTAAGQGANGAADECGGGAGRSLQSTPQSTHLVTAPATTVGMYGSGSAAITAPYGDGNGIGVTTPDALSAAPSVAAAASVRQCSDRIPVEGPGGPAYCGGGGGGGNHGGSGHNRGSGGRSAPHLSYGTPSFSSELGVGGDGDRGSSGSDGGLYGSDGDEDSDPGCRGKDQERLEGHAACGCVGPGAAASATTTGGFMAWLRRCCGGGGGLQHKVFESVQQRGARPRRRKGQQRSVASATYSSLQSLQTAMCCLQDSEMLHVRRTLLAALEIYNWLKERSQGGGLASAALTAPTAPPATSPQRDLHSRRGVRAELHALRRSSMRRWISPRVLLDELLMVYGGLTDSDIPVLARHFAEAVWECAAPEGTCLTREDFLHIFPHEGDRRIAWDALDGDKDGLLKLSDIAAAVVSFLQQGRSMALTVRALRGLTLSLQSSLIAIINGIFLMAAYLSILDLAHFFNTGGSSSKTSLDIFSVYVLVVSLIFSEQIKHVLSGCVLILSQQPFDVGEELVIEEAPGWRVMGVVQDFNLFFLRVKKSTDGELVTLPLNKLTSSRFTNLTRSDWKIEQNYLAVDASTPPSILAAISAAATQVINATPGEYDVSYGFLAVFHGFEKPNKVVIRTFHRYRFNLAAPHKRIALGRHGIMAAVRETLDKYGIEFSELRLHAPLPPGCLPYGPGMTVATDAAAAAAAAVVGAPGAVAPAALEEAPSSGLLTGGWGTVGRWGIATGANWGHAGGGVRG